MERNDFYIGGISETNGGIFNNVSIRDSSIISGDVDCIELKLFGKSKIGGDVLAEDITLSGASNIDGDIIGASVKMSGACKIIGNAKDLKYLSASGISQIGGSVSGGLISLSGTSIIDGDVVAKVIKASGASTINGNIKANLCKANGVFGVDGDINSDKFISSGAFSIDGLLNCEHIEINLGGKSKVKKISGNTITVKNNKETKIKMFFNLMIDNVLMTDIIEGDSIYLQNTVAKVVRGRNIIIGEGCKIELVEYKNSLKFYEQYIVNNTKKI